MKRILLSMLVIAMMATPAAFADAGGKKKTKKKAKTECCKEKCCDPKNCAKDAKCVPAPVCKAG